MNINLLPDELKKKYRVNRIILIINIIIIIMIFLLITLSFILQSKNKSILSNIQKIDKEIIDEKYIYSENILKDIESYKKSIDLTNEYSGNINTIEVNDIIYILNKLSQHSKLLSLEYNLDYMISIKAVAKTEEDIKKTIDEFLLLNIGEINIIDRTILKDGVIEFEFNIIL